MTGGQQLGGQEAPQARGMIAQGKAFSIQASGQISCGFQS